MVKYIDHEIMMSALRCNHFLCGSWLYVTFNCWSLSGPQVDYMNVSFWNNVHRCDYLAFNRYLAGSPVVVFFILFFAGLGKHFINPLNPKSDQHLISPPNITPESRIKVMRIKEMVTMKGTFRLARKFSLSASWECTKNKGENMDTDVTV